MAGILARNLYMGRTMAWQADFDARLQALTAAEVERQVIAATNMRKIGKRNMVRNSGTPTITVDPETFAVTVDGKHATVKPLTLSGLPSTSLALFSKIGRAHV